MIAAVIQYQHYHRQKSYGLKDITRAQMKLLQSLEYVRPHLTEMQRRCNQVLDMEQELAKVKKVAQFVRDVHAMNMEYLRGIVNSAIDTLTQKQPPSSEEQY